MANEPEFYDILIRVNPSDDPSLTIDVKFRQERSVILGADYPEGVKAAVKTLESCYDFSAAADEFEIAAEELRTKEDQETDEHG